MNIKPDISIAIVNYNGSEYLDRCLKSLYETRGDLELDIWVVDNGSSDNSLPLLRDQYPQVHVIANNENAGFAKANNQALRQVACQYILFLNNDTVVQPEALQTMLVVMEAHPQLAALGPQLLNEDGTIQPSCMRFPSPWLSVRNYVKVLGGGSAKYVPDSGKELEIVNAVTGACMLIRREALEQVGELDEGFFMYAEETDWAYRAAKIGWQVGYVPDATVYHLGGRSAQREPNRFYVEQRYGRVRFYLKHHGRLYAHVESALVRLNILLRWLVHRNQRHNYAEILRMYNAKTKGLFQP